MGNASPSRAVLPPLEWEFLSEPRSFSTRDNEAAWPTGTQTVRVWRDDSYRLQAAIEGNIGSIRAEGIDENGVSVPSLYPVDPSEGWSSLFSATATLDHFPYRFEACEFTGGAWRRRSSDAERVDNFGADMLVGEVRGENPHAGARLWLTDWFLNGTSSQRFYSRYTMRKLDEHRFRERMGSGLAPFSPRPGGVEDGGRDYMLIDTGPVKCLVAKVPAGLGPTWSHNLGIEYHAQWGIPGEDVRIAVAEIVGFIMGRHLLRVGSTEIGALGTWLSHSAVNPPGLHIRSVCELQDHRPIICGAIYRAPDDDTWGECERIIRALLPLYLELREDQRLGDALRRYTLSYEIPPEAAIPTVASALEILNDGWYQSARTKGPKHYLSPAEYQQLVGDEVNSIATRLQERVPEHAASMMNKIRTAYSVPTSRRIPWFLAQIGVPPNDFEREILASRNGAVHGGRFDTDASVGLLTDAFRTLFHRAFLKILGYDGSYIDRSQPQWVLRAIDEPMGE